MTTLSRHEQFRSGFAAGIILIIIVGRRKSRASACAIERALLTTWQATTLFLTAELRLCRLICENQPILALFETSCWLLWEIIPGLSRAGLRPVCHHLTPIVATAERGIDGGAVAEVVGCRTLFTRGRRVAGIDAIVSPGFWIWGRLQWASNAGIRMSSGGIPSRIEPTSCFLLQTIAAIR